MIDCPQNVLDLFPFQPVQQLVRMMILCAETINVYQRNGNVMNRQTVMMVVMKLKHYVSQSDGSFTKII